MSSRIRTILGLFAYLAVIYNLDKLGIQAGVSLTLYPVLYVVMTMAILLVIAFSAQVKIPLVGCICAWSAVYLIGRWVLYPASRFWVGMNIYQTVTEMTLLAVAVALAYHLAIQLHQIEELGSLFSLPTSVRQVRTLHSAIEDIKVEFVRSRRYNHPLSLMVIEPSQFTLKEDLNRIIRENQKKVSRRYLAARLAEIIIHQARRTDMIMTKDWDGHFIILCPENNTDGTSTLAQRIQADVKNSLGVSIQYGIAAFPSDALTWEELVRRAETNMAASGTDPQILPGHAKEKFEPVLSADQPVNEENVGNSASDHEVEIVSGPPSNITDL